MTRDGAGQARARAVFFDWYGTLVPLAPLDAACDALAPGRGTELAQRWRARQLEGSWLRTIMGRWADFDRITRDALVLALGEMAIDVDPAQVSELTNVFLGLPVRQDAGVVLDELRGRGVTIGILSNASVDALRNGMAANRLTPDHAISADSARVFKPHPGIYRLAVDATALPPRQIGFVTANGWDASGATAFGFQVLWLRTEAATGLPAVGSPPDHVGSWGDVVPILIGAT